MNPSFFLNGITLIKGTNQIGVKINTPSTIIDHIKALGDNHGFFAYRVKFGYTFALHHALKNETIFQNNNICQNRAAKHQTD